MATQVQRSIINFILSGETSNPPNRGQFWGEGGFGIDTGGDWVYRGINMRHNPRTGTNWWDGWVLVDRALSSLSMSERNEILTRGRNRSLHRGFDIPELDNKVLERYTTDSRYWPRWLSNINDRSVVAQLFDQNIVPFNSGGGQAILRRALGMVDQSISIEDVVREANNQTSKFVSRIIQQREANYRGFNSDGTLHERGASPHVNHYITVRIPAIRDFTGSTSFRNSVTVETPTTGTPTFITQSPIRTTITSTSEDNPTPVITGGCETN